MRVSIGIPDIGVISNRTDIRMAHAIVQANLKGPHCLDVWWVPLTVQRYVADYVNVPLALGHNLPILIAPSLVPLKVPDELPQPVAILGELS